MRYAPILAALALAGCVTKGSVMEMEGGAYSVSARAAPAAGGASGAQTAAHEEASAFCAKKGRRAVVVDAKDRDVYQGAAAASWGRTSGSAGGGMAAAGQATLTFRCE